MRKNKILGVAFFAAIAALSASCASQNIGGDSSQSSKDSSSDSTTPSSSQDLSGADLVYANWDLGTAEENNLERQMIAAFNTANHCNVKILENINTNAYEDALIALAGKQQMPDVFMLTNTTFGLSNQYLADMTSYANADTDWAKIPASVSASSKYKDKVYALPFAIHMMGFFENDDLLDEKNLSALNVSPSWNDLNNVIESLKQPNNGIMGLDKESTLFEWYPAQLNASFGWFSFDGSSYHLDSTEMATAMALTKKLHDDTMTFDSLSNEQITSLGYKDTGSVGMWNAGKLGLRYGYTYEIPDMLAHSKFNKKFIGVPGGRTPIVPDFLGVSPTCKNPALAYKFAKWMSFDPDGIKKRLEFDSDGTLFSSLPLSTDSSVITAYFDAKYNRVPGLEEAFRASDSGIVEGVKVIPGYGKSRWNARAGTSITITVNGQPISNPTVGQLIDQCWYGSLAWANYSSGLNDIANKQYQNALATFSGLYS